MPNQSYALDYVINIYNNLLFEACDYCYVGSILVQCKEVSLRALRLLKFASY
jgi:hypothetical protein